VFDPSFSIFSSQCQQETILVKPSAPTVCDGPSSSLFSLLDGFHGLVMFSLLTKYHPLPRLSLVDMGYYLLAVLEICLVPPHLIKKIQTSLSSKGSIKRQKLSFQKGYLNFLTVISCFSNTNYSLMPSEASSSPTTPVNFLPYSFLTFLLILTTGKLNLSYSFSISLQTSSNNFSSCKKLWRK